MNNNALTPNSSFLIRSLLVAAVIIAAAAGATAQDGAKTDKQAGPVISDLKGIKIGMTKDEVKEKLGKPSTADKSSLMYTRSKDETIEIGLDSKGNVRTVALIYTNDNADTPKFSDIFGPDVPMETKKNGSVYNLVRYPSAGFWIAYSRSVIDKKPLTTITMRKLETR